MPCKNHTIIFRGKLPRVENLRCPDCLWRSERCLRSSTRSRDQIFLQINLTKVGCSSVLNISSWVGFQNLSVKPVNFSCQDEAEHVLIFSNSLSFGVVVSVMFLWSYQFRLCFTDNGCSYVSRVRTIAYRTYRTPVQYTIQYFCNVNNTPSSESWRCFSSKPSTRSDSETGLTISIHAVFQKSDVEILNAQYWISICGPILNESSRKRKW